MHFWMKTCNFGIPSYFIFNCALKDFILCLQSASRLWSLQAGVCCLPQYALHRLPQPDWRYSYWGWSQGRSWRKHGMIINSKDGLCCLLKIYRSEMVLTIKEITSWGQANCPTISRTRTQTRRLHALLTMVLTHLTWATSAQHVTEERYYNILLLNAEKAGWMLYPRHQIKVCSCFGSCHCHIFY